MAELVDIAAERVLVEALHVRLQDHVARRTGGGRADLARGGHQRRQPGPGRQPAERRPVQRRRRLRHGGAGGGKQRRRRHGVHQLVGDRVDVDVGARHLVRVLGGEVRLEGGARAEQRLAERTALVDQLLVGAVLALPLASPRVLEPYLHTHTHTSYHYTHTHTHPFTGPLSRTTWVGRYQKGKTNLDFTEARDSEWQWHQLGHMQACTSLQTDNHTSTPPLKFFTGRMPFLPPNQQRQNTEGTINTANRN